MITPASAATQVARPVTARGALVTDLADDRALPRREKGSPFAVATAEVDDSNAFASGVIRPRPGDHRRNLDR